MHLATKSASKKEVVRKYTLEEKKKIVEKYVSELAFSLNEDLKKFKGRAQSVCPNSECGRVLKKKERLAGYRKNLADSRTICPRCFTRFQPKLVVFDGKNELLINLCSKAHVLHFIGSWFELSPEDILKSFPDVYYSCIYNFGSLKEAFKEIQIKYDYLENPYWIEAVIPYLGNMPDQEIAKCVKSIYPQISLLRRNRGIKKFSSADAFRKLVPKT